MERKRESNYDLLRIISAVAVIMIHVSASYLGAITSDELFGQYYLEHIYVSCFYNVISRFAVPCFVMLSGAFILADERNAEYSYFYKKEFRNVGILTLIFSGAYFACSLLLEVPGVVSGGESMSSLLTPIWHLVKGEPFGHMWYLYMLLGLYLLAPAVIRFRRAIEEKTFSRIVWVFLVLASVSFVTSTHELNWDIGFQFYYLGYFMAGYEIRKWALERKNNYKGICLILLGLAVELGVTYLRYRQALAGITDEELKYQLVLPLCPLIVIASVLIFAGFSLLNLRRDFGKMSSHTFLIYLLHAGIWSVLVRVIKLIFGAGGDNRVLLPISVLAVFLLSYLTAVIFKKIWEFLVNK